MKNSLAFLADMIAGFAPLAPAALGGLVTEYVGVLNISLEGLILAGGFSYIAFGSVLGPIGGLMGAALVPALIAWGSDVFGRKARADSFVIGLGINLLIPGLISIISQKLFMTKGVVSLPSLISPHLSESISLSIPLVGPFLFAYRVSDYLAFALFVLLVLLLAATPFGLRAKAAGLNSDSLRMAGVDPVSIRALAYAFSGFSCGIAGAVLASSIGAWVPNLSAGRGWIALVAVYLGGKKLGGTLAAVLLFSLLLSLGNRAQAFRAIPAELLSSLPYVITAFVVIIGSFLRHAKSNTRI